MSEKTEAVQVVFAFPEVFEQFKQWLDDRGLSTFPIPVEDDLPTYGITLRAASNQDTDPAKRPT